MSDGATRIGVIGAGGFGLFALQHFTQVPGVRLVAMAGTHREAAIATAQRFGVPDLQSVESLLARDDVDLVYVATPPFLHHPQAMAALAAGKHVIVEKPLALTLEQADEAIALARQRELLLVTNLMQRYNPLFATVRALIERRVLGEVLHARFENLAADEQLGPGHWFWDRAQSGGIFVEHGVHFFDLLEGWLGPAQVVAAQRVLRPGSGLEEQVQCTLRHGNGALTDLHHGFTQPRRLDRQELRIVFERGDLKLEEWVPVRGRIHAVADEAQTRALVELFPEARLDIGSQFGTGERVASGRHRRIEIHQELDLTFGAAALKMHRYGELLRSMIRDQLAWIHDRSHARVITEANGRRSLELSLEARAMADASA